MNRKIISLLSFCIFLFSINSFVIGQSRNSTFGLVHTPKGNLHVLVIFIQHKNDTIDWDGWKHHELPDFATGENNDLLSSQISDIGTKGNLSTWYSDMSLGKFKFTGDIFPECIPVSANLVGNDVQVNKEAVAYINKHYPDYDWSKYDTRINKANWKKDNSNSEPDGRLDYVIMLYRKKGMNGYAAISGSKLMLKGNKEYYINDGYTSIGTSPSANSINDLFIHEFGHNLYMGPHLGNANGVIGQYFRGTYGWSMSNADKRIFYTCNAWERWYLGWSDITYDIQKPVNDTIVEIEDYITTGDVVRVRIPHSDQFIWLENHQKTNQFDRHRFERNGYDQLHNEPLPGVYAFVENLSPSRTKIHNFAKAANGMRVLHPLGKFDFTYKDSAYIENKWWGQTAYNFYTKQVNPIDGNSLLDLIFNDYDHNGSIKYNNDGNHPRTHKNEFSTIYSIDDSLNCAWSGEYLNFKAGDKIALNSNTLALPNRRYDQYKKSLEPAYLNGLNIEILSIKNGKARIKIRYNDYVLTNNTRWTGQEIILQKDTAYLTTKPILKVFGELQISKSETPSTHQMIDNSYNRPTVFRALENTTIHIKKEGFLSFDTQSSLLIEQGATLIIDKGATVLFSDSTHLLVEQGAKILNNGKLILNSKVTNQLPKAALISVIPQRVRSLDELITTTKAQITEKMYLRTITPLYLKGDLVKTSKARRIIKRFNKAEISDNYFMPKHYYDFIHYGKQNSIAVRGRHFTYKGLVHKKKFLGI